MKDGQEGCEEARAIMDAQQKQLRKACNESHPALFPPYITQTVMSESGQVAAWVLIQHIKISQYGADGVCEVGTFRYAVSIARKHDKDDLQWKAAVWIMNDVEKRRPVGDGISVHDWALGPEVRIALEGDYLVVTTEKGEGCRVSISFPSTGTRLSVQQDTIPFSPDPDPAAKCAAG